MGTLLKRALLFVPSSGWARRQGTAPAIKITAITTADIQGFPRLRMMSISNAAIFADSGIVNALLLHGHRLRSGTVPGGTSFLHF